MAQRHECRGRHVEHQPAVAEESEGQAIETAEGEAGRRGSDAQAFQRDDNGSGWAWIIRAVSKAVAREFHAALCQGFRTR